MTAALPHLLAGCLPFAVSEHVFRCWVDTDLAPDALPGGTRLVWRTNCGRGEAWREYQMTYDRPADDPERRLVATYAAAVDGTTARRLYPTLLTAMAAVAAQMQRVTREEAA